MFDDSRENVGNAANEDAAQTNVQHGTQVDTQVNAQADAQTNVQAQVDAESAAQVVEQAVIPLKDNSYVQELYDILEDNGKDTSGLTALIGHISDMENFAKGADKQIAAMKTQLDTMKEAQNHPIRTALQNTIKNIENKVDGIKSAITNLKTNFIEGCKNAVNSFKQMGITALDKITSFLRIKPALQAISKDCDFVIKRCDKAIANVETFAKEYHATGLHLKNMARMVIGREPLDKQKEVGKLAKAMCAPHRHEKACMNKIKSAAGKCIVKIEQLEKSAAAVRDGKEVSNEAVNHSPTADTAHQTQPKEAAPISKEVDPKATGTDVVNIDTARKAKPRLKVMGGQGVGAVKAPSLMQKIAENKEKIRQLDLERGTPVPAKAVGAVL